jgi:hypothetical protein
MRRFRAPAAAFAALFALVAAAPASAKVLIVVDKSTQQMTVSVDGTQRWTWPVSTGQLGHDTPAGDYTAFRMEAEHFSKEWDDAPMPHSIFFTQRGHAIHGYLNPSHIGQPASHGCVRLNADNATKLFALVEAQGMSNTKVEITGDVRVALARRGLPANEARQAGVQQAQVQRPLPHLVQRQPIEAQAYGYARMDAYGRPIYPNGYQVAPGYPAAGYAYPAAAAQTDYPAATWRR